MGRVVRFPPPAGPEPVSPDHPVCHVPSVAGAVEAFFAGRDLAPTTCRTYRQARDPLVQALDGDRPVRGYRRKWTKDNGFVGRLMRRVVVWGWGCDCCLVLVG